MGKTRYLLKKIRDGEGTLHAKMGTIKDKNDMDLSEAKDNKKRLKEYIEELCKKNINDPGSHDVVITCLGLDILKCEVKGAFRSVTMSKARGGDGIAGELFEILRDDAAKVLHSICQQIWKTQQWPQDWKGPLHCNPKERLFQRMFNYHAVALISHTTQVISPSKSSTVHEL